MPNVSRIQFRKVEIMISILVPCYFIWPVQPLFPLRQPCHMPWKILEQINNKIQTLIEFFVSVTNLALNKHSQIKMGKSKIFLTLLLKVCIKLKMISTVGIKRKYIIILYSTQNELWNQLHFVLYKIKISIYQFEFIFCFLLYL